MTRKHMSAKFPSPVGELHFSMVARNSPSPNIQFPSPVGELHFSIWKWNHLYFCAGVSVPCRGTTFLNQIRQKSRNDNWFPSPVGELHFSIITVPTFKLDKKGFRPLSGNYISQCTLTPHPKFKIVSVPCRGTTFLNSRLVDSSNRTQRFRPLSGNYISQYKKHNLK